MIPVVIVRTPTAPKVVVARTRVPDPQNVFIQVDQPTDNQTVGLDNYIWYELWVDGTLKTVWHGRRA